MVSRQFTRRATTTALMVAAALAGSDAFAAQITSQAPVAQLLPRSPGCPGAPDSVLAGPTGSDYDAFGTSAVWIDDRLLVGHRGDDTQAQDVGSVHVYSETTQGWEIEETLRPPSATTGQHFGWTLATDRVGDVVRLVVGAPGTSGGSAGAVHLFENDGGGWTSTAVLSGNPGIAIGFGVSVAIDGDTLVVGAPFETTVDASIGGVTYVFEHDGRAWSEVAQLTAAVVNGGGLGASVDLEDDRMIVGAPYVGNEWIPGKAVVYRRVAGTWTHEQDLQHTTPGGRDRFGTAVALHRGRAWVGSPRDLPPTVGSVVSFTFDATAESWQPVQTMLAPDYQAFDRFGGSLTLDGTQLVVGAPTWGLTPRAREGRVYLFDVSSGTATFQCTFAPPVPAPQELFGQFVRLSGGRLLIGSPFDDVVATDDGSLALYTLTPGAMLGSR